MIKIRLLGGSRVPGLHRPDGDAAWLATPEGMPTRAGGGPVNTTCVTCIHLILAESKWSDQGRCAPCAERRRLSRKPAQEVPLRWRSCSRYEAGPNAEAALAAAAAAKVDERIVEKREKVRQYEAVVRRLHEELRELALYARMMARTSIGEILSRPSLPDERRPRRPMGGERRGLGHNCRLRRPEHVWR